MKKTILSLVIGLQIFMSQNALADHRGGFVSQHYHRNDQVQQRQVIHNHNTYVHRTYAPRVIHRRIYRHYYQPYFGAYYQPVVVHYHSGFLEPCYEEHLEPQNNINVNIGSGGWSVGIGSEW